MYKKEYDYSNSTLPKGYKLVITAEYFYSEWNGEYKVRFKSTLVYYGEYIAEYLELVNKPNKFIRKFFFFKYKNEYTWSDACNEMLSQLLKVNIDVAYENQRVQKVNDGLFDTLEEL